MDKLIFIDTNIFLDFYRIRNSDVSMKYLKLIDRNHDKIIVTDQVEMEFKKHRLEIIQESLKALKPPDLANSAPPAIVSDAEPARIMERLRSDIQKQHKKLKDRIYKVLENPAAHDQVYQTLQRLFKNKDSVLNLHRDNSEKYRIRKLAMKRFYLGCPPRKKNDTSIGDALNWEWIIKCCSDIYKSVIVVSRDTDYGIHLENKSLINDFLNQEFKDRISNRKTVIFTNKLSVAFKALSTPGVTKQMESVEQQIIKEETANSMREALEVRKGAFFWEELRENLIELFKENEAITDRKTE